MIFIANSEKVKARKHAVSPLHAMAVGNSIDTM
jgi:hypothetical protein